MKVKTTKVEKKIIFEVRTYPLFPKKEKDLSFTSSNSSSPCRSSDSEQEDKEKGRKASYSHKSSKMFHVRN